MTAREMDREFEQSAHFIDAINKKNLRVITKDRQFFLNEAQHVFINTRLKNFRNSIDRKQKDLDEIRAIIEKGTTLVQDVGASTPEIYVYDLPANYRFLISDYSTTNFCSVSRRYQNRLMSSENLQEALHGWHTKPKYNSPISELIGSKLYVYRDFDLTFDLDNVIIDYVRSWNLIDVAGGVDSELDENVHKDIVQLAVTLFLEAVESGRFQTNVEKNTITEQV